MPELPEVETIRRDLEKVAVGKRIAGFQVLNKKSVWPENIAKRLKDVKIKRLERRAKLLIFELSDGGYLLIHLKLTGQLIYQAAGPNKFTRAIFTFADKSRLFFNDPRKFGYIKLVSVKELEKIKNKYGVEPLSQDFSLKKFEEILARRPRLKIKQLLMDQSLIAGLGNIYSDEVCFQAGVMPARLTGSLSASERQKLRQAVIRVLKLSLAKRGASAKNYVDAYGREGGFASYLKVYGRTGKKCFRCGATLTRVKIGGRSSHYCPKCQK